MDCKQLSLHSRFLDTKRKDNKGTRCFTEPTEQKRVFFAAKTLFNHEQYSSFVNSGR